jgi:hypothetical protein
MLFLFSYPTDRYHNDSRKYIRIQYILKFGKMLSALHVMNILKAADD